MIDVTQLKVGSKRRYTAVHISYDIEVLEIGLGSVRADWVEVRNGVRGPTHKSLKHSVSDYLIFPLTFLHSDKKLEDFF